MSTIQLNFPTCTHIFIVDFEATCGPGVSASDIEIIEFGGILLPLAQAVDPEQGVPFHQYIKPIKNPKLTRFCTKLTGVTQSDVNDAEEFLSVMSVITDWFSELQVSMSKTLFTSWSPFDGQQLKRECLHNDIPCPFLHFLDLQHCFKQTQQQSTMHSVSKALEIVGLEFEGRQHSAIDDARNTARLLPYSGYSD